MKSDVECVFCQIIIKAHSPLYICILHIVNFPVCMFSPSRVPKENKDTPVPRAPPAHRVRLEISDLVDPLDKEDQV